jgi:hypothetical protein
MSPTPEHQARVAIDAAPVCFERLQAEFLHHRCHDSALRRYNKPKKNDGELRTGDEAVKWLRTSAATGLPNYPCFSRDPHLDRIRKETVFIQFMNELKTRWDGYKREFE